MRIVALAVSFSNTDAERLWTDVERWQHRKGRVQAREDRDQRSHGVDQPKLAAVLHAIRRIHQVVSCAGRKCY